MESNKTEVLSFDIDKYNSRECQVHNHGFYLGEQSKQAEVEELQKRVDLSLNKSEDFYDFGDGESAMAFCNEIINILKGDYDE